LIEEYSEVPRWVRHHAVHAPAELALLYFVGALAEAPASARFDAPAERMTSAAAIVTRLLLIVSSSLEAPRGRFSHVSRDARACLRTMIRNLAMRKN
jgi:hypothetical protein